MSDTTTVLHPVEALGIANRFRALITVNCHRTDVVGSLRRHEPEVHDIEILCEPMRMPTLNIFGEVLGWDSNVDELLDSLLITGEVVKRPDKHGRPAWGSRYKRLWYQGAPVDLFCCLPPASYGLLLMIRTGPAAFSHKMVTPRYLGGLMPNDYRVKDGQVWHFDRSLPCPTEEELFRLWNLPYVQPENRGQVTSAVDVVRLMAAKGA